MQDQLQAVIMAAGRSSRFKTSSSKLLEKICDQEMILYPSKALASLKIETCVVVGYLKELIEAVLTKEHGDQISFMTQLEPKGTAHALICSAPTWYKEHILVMNGDMPLVTPELIHDLWQQHQQHHASVSFVATNGSSPDFASYGKVFAQDNLIKIIEAKDYQNLIAQDASIMMSDSNLVNAGIYIFKTAFLKTAIEKLQASKTSGEFYITDLIEIASVAKAGVQILQAPNELVRGVNTNSELVICEQIKQAQLTKQNWLKQVENFKKELI